MEQSKGYPSSWDFEEQEQEPLKLSERFKEQKRKELERVIESSKSVQSIATVNIAKANKELSELGADVSNSFPSDIFRPQIVDMVNGLYVSNGYKKDFCYSMILSTLSVAIGNSIHVEVRNGYTVGTSNYMVLVGGTGVGKSPVMNWFLKPIRNIEDVNYSKYETAYSEWERNGRNGKEPQFQQIVVSDITIEALNPQFNKHKRGLILEQDEIVQWIRNNNRYGGTNGSAVWLSLFDQKPTTTNRKSSKHERVQLPFISVVGGIQPNVVKELFQDDRNANGFIQRLLFAFPFDQSKAYLSENEIEPKWETFWNNIVRSIYDVKFNCNDIGTPVPFVVKFSKEAKAKYLEWYNGNADYCNSLEETDISKSIYDKKAVHLPRIALILEVLERSHSNQLVKENNECKPFEVTETSVKNAINVLNYFTYNAVRIASKNMVQPLTELEQLLYRYDNEKQTLYYELPTTFTTQQALAIGSNLGLSDKQVRYFLKKTELFKTHGRNGNYTKVHEFENISECL